MIATSYSAVVWYPPWVAPFKGRLTLRNNVFIAANQYNGVGLYVGYGKAQLGVNLKLNDNTFVNTVPIQVGFLDRPQEPKPLLQRPLQWKLTNNVSDGRNCFLSIRNLKPDEFPDQDVPSFMQKHFAWDEAQHVHGEYHTFLRIDKKKSVPTELGLMSLDSWQKWWGLPPNGSLQGEIRFSGGDLLAKCKSSPLGITPADCRLAVHSTGHGAGPGGKDLGADVDRVGPAKAYEAWKKTPAYQQWRKKTEELMDK